VAAANGLRKADGAGANVRANSMAPLVPVIEFWAGPAAATKHRPEGVNRRVGDQSR
jgi:hypothetical protein